MNGTKYGVPSAQLNPATPYANYTTFNKQQTFIYDGVGNRQEFDDGADTYLYNRPAGGGVYTPSNVNEYYRIRKNGTDTSRTYDANGNLTNDGTFAYKYNYQNQLIEVDPAGGGTAVQTNNYNCFGLRIYKQASPPVYYYQDGPRVIETHDGSDTLIASYVFGDSIDEVLTSNIGGSTYSASSNPLYSLALWTDASANNVEKDTYDVFGHPTTSAWLPIPGGGFGWTAVTDSKVAAFMFTGREWDAAIGDYYFRARYMNPLEGRFTARGPNPCTRESVGSSGGVPQFSSSDLALSDSCCCCCCCCSASAYSPDTSSVPPSALECRNLYSYALNSPTALVDPSGQDVFVTIDGAQAVYEKDECPVGKHAGDLAWGTLRGQKGGKGSCYTVKLYRVGVWSSDPTADGPPAKLISTMLVTRDTADDNGKKGDRTPDERSQPATRYSENHETPPCSCCGRPYNSPNLGEVLILSDDPNGVTLQGPERAKSQVYIHQGPGMSQGCFLCQGGKPEKNAFMAAVKQAVQADKAGGGSGNIRVVVEDRHANGK